MLFIFLAFVGRNYLVILCTLSIMAPTSAQELPFSFPQTKTPVPLTIKVDESLLAFAKERARTYRPTAGLSSEWTLEGPPKDKLTDLAKHWAETYDWHSVQDKINKDFKHYATTVPGNGDYKPDIPLHFIHHPSSNPDATPLLLLHGWPSTNLLWSSLFEPLSKDFHLVAPNYPGFGFSPAPVAPGLDPRVLGNACDALMKQLGYERYGLVSTDLGWLVAMHMVQTVEESIIGHFADFVLANPTPEDQERLAKGEVTKEEEEYINAMNVWNTQHFAYATMHATKPLLLGQALSDSPVGYAGWIWDLMEGSSSGYQYSLDYIITASIMLWIQGPYVNLRAYTEALKVRFVFALFLETGFYSMSRTDARLCTPLARDIWRLEQVRGSRRGRTIRQQRRPFPGSGQV